MILRLRATFKAPMPALVKNKKGVNYMQHVFCYLMVLYKAGHMNPYWKKFNR